MCLRGGSFFLVLDLLNVHWPSEIDRPAMALQGTFRILLFYDVADSINLVRLKSISEVRLAERLPSFPRLTPEYVRFELTPVIQPLDPVELETGDRLEARLKYYDCGVTGLEMDLPFFCDWAGMVRLSREWIAASRIEKGCDVSDAPQLEKDYALVCQALHKLVG